LNGSRQFALARFGNRCFIKLFIVLACGCIYLRIHSLHERRRALIVLSLDSLWAEQKSNMREFVGQKSGARYRSATKIKPPSTDAECPFAAVGTGIYYRGKFGQVIHGMSQRSLERLYLEEDHFVTHVIALFYPLEILSGYKMIDRA
jgi:hypothetical protein